MNFGEEFLTHKRKGTSNTPRGSSNRSLITINDVTWVGHARFPMEGDSASTHAGSNWEGYSCGLAVRYAFNREVTPAVERLYTICNFSTAGGKHTWIGDLVEYRAPALTQGSITAANPMVEVRRWAYADWFVTSTAEQWAGEHGVLGGLYWQPDLTDSNGGVLWVSIWGSYHGAENAYQSIYAVKLSNTIVSGNYATVVQKYGPWKYGATNGMYKESSLGMTDIPEYAQAAVGNRKYAIQGTYTSVSSEDYLQYGPNLRGITDFPTLATSAPWNLGDVLTRGNAIMTHAKNDDTPFGNARLPGTVTDIGAVERLFYTVQRGGTFQNWNNPDPPVPIAAGTTVGDAIYITASKYGATCLNFWVYMSTPATGGTRVVEYSKGAGVWGTLTGTWSHGSANLTTGKNNFVLSSTPGDWAQDTVNAVTDYWIRVRITSAPSVGGFVKNTGIHVNVPSPDGNYTGENWFPAGDVHQGLVWVDTGSKHGIICFARRSRGYVWYGEYHGFKLSEEIAPEDDFAETFDQTVHGYHFQYTDPAFYVYDPVQVMAAAGAGKRSNIGPPTTANWVAKWSNVPYRYISTNANDLRYLDLWQANVTFFDRTTNQIIYNPPKLTNGDSTGAPALEVFQV